MASNANRTLYGRQVLWPFAFLWLILPAYADDRTDSEAAEEYVQCLRSDQTLVDRAATAGFLTREGLTPSAFSLWSAGDGAPIAQVFVERPDDDRFEQVGASMQALVEDVATLRHVPTARKELAGGVNIISVIPTTPGKSFAGISMLFDPRRSEIVQWYWQSWSRAPGRDLAALQATVWRQLNACISQRGIAENEKLAANRTDTVPSKLREHPEVVKAADRD